MEITSQTSSSESLQKPRRRFSLTKLLAALIIPLAVIGLIWLILMAVYKHWCGNGRSEYSVGTPFKMSLPPPTGMPVRYYWDATYNASHGAAHNFTEAINWHAGLFYSTNKKAKCDKGVCTIPYQLEQSGAIDPADHYNLSMKTFKTLAPKKKFGNLVTRLNPLDPAIVPVFYDRFTDIPVEIAAASFFFELHNQTSELTNRTSAFVTPIDFFITDMAFTGFSEPKSKPSVPKLKSPEWHVVYPAFEKGSLRHFKKSDIKRHHTDLDDVDTILRPSFNNLLASLNNMHTLGYCHNNIDEDTIFVDNKYRLFLGEFGDIRGNNSAYYSTKQWRKAFDQYTDCRWNDVRRALNTYLNILRYANRHNFDVAFFKGETSWSALYWTLLDSYNNRSDIDCDSPATLLLSESRSHEPRTETGEYLGRYKGIFRRHAVHRLLRTDGIPLWRRWFESIFLGGSRGYRLRFPHIGHH